MSGERVRRIIKVIVRVVSAAVGVVLTTGCALWVGLDANGLEWVLARDLDVKAGWELTPSWFAWVLLCTASFALVAAPKPKFKVDVLPIVLAIWIVHIVPSAVSFSSSFQFAMPRLRTCVYKGCWPLYWQDAAIACPLALTVIIMVILAIGGRRINFWVRALVPSVVYAVTTVLLALIWKPYLLPFFLFPPP